MSAPFGLTPFNWSYFSYTYADGWGYVYHSDYSLAQVLTYLLAFASGAVLYPILTKPRWLGMAASVLCVIGGISFLIELSHRFSDHHLSLIVNGPVVLLLIAGWTIIGGLIRKPGPRVCTT